MRSIDDLGWLATAADRFQSKPTAGRDRYGRADAILFAHRRFASVRRCGDDGHDVALWDELERLVAWGHTSNTSDITCTLQSLDAGHSPQQLSDNSGYLTAVSDSAAVEVLWHLLLHHGDEYLRKIASQAAGDPVLRQLQPWVGHGTLHLLHHTHTIESTRCGLAFHPTGDGRYRVGIYNQPLGPVQDTQTAVRTASETAATW